MSFQGTLLGLITIAWNVDNDRIIGLPKFADTDHFDIIADPPASVTRPLDNETVRRMLQALLADRFALAVHLGEQPMDVYVLGAPKAEVKMKRGNDAERGSCKGTPEGLRVNSGLSNALTCTNRTMPQLADKIRGMAPAYVNHPAVDETRLDGAWDFDLMWTRLGSLNGRVKIGQPDDRTDALAQPGSPTFFESIEKQLGLKLTLQKRPMPVLIIDHLNSKPTQI